MAAFCVCNMPYLFYSVLVACCTCPIYTMQICKYDLGFTRVQCECRPKELFARQTLMKSSSDTLQLFIVRLIHAYLQFWSWPHTHSCVRPHAQSANSHIWAPVALFVLFMRIEHISTAVLRSRQTEDFCSYTKFYIGERHWCEVTSDLSLHTLIVFLVVLFVFLDI